MKALAVFHNHGAGLFQPVLKPGFRHVFVAIASGDYWITIDGKNGVPVAEVVAPSDYDLAAFYEDEGYTVVAVEQRTQPPRGPLAAANCVGMVKAALAVRSWALTPYQLYKHLMRS